MSSSQNCSSIKRRGDEACSIHFGAVYLTYLVTASQQLRTILLEMHKGIKRNLCMYRLLWLSWGQLLLEDDQIVCMCFKNKNIDWPVWEDLLQVKLSHEKAPNSDWASGCTSETVYQSVFNGRVLPQEEFSKAAISPRLPSCLLGIQKYQRLRCLIWCFGVFFVCFQAIKLR